MGTDILGPHISLALQFLFSPRDLPVGPTWRSLSLAPASLAPRLANGPTVQKPRGVSRFAGVWDHFVRPVPNHSSHRPGSPIVDATIASMTTPRARGLDRIISHCASHSDRIPSPEGPKPTPATRIASLGTAGKSAHRVPSPLRAAT